MDWLTNTPLSLISAGFFLKDEEVEMALTHMFDDLNPQLPYYLIFFLITIILRLIRAYRSRPKDDPESLKDYWVLYVTK